MIEFKPKKGFFFALMHLGLPLVYAVGCVVGVRSLINENVNTPELTLVIGLLLLSGFYFVYLLYTWSVSRYFSDGKFFKFNFGYFKGEIEIAKITTIKKSTYPSSGYRPTFHWHGYTIYYKVSDEKHVPRKQLFVSPMEEDKFLNSMLRSNPNIAIKK